MRAVLEKTQELAEAILESECYQKMKRLEGETRRDEEAAVLHHRSKALAEAWLRGQLEQLLCIRHRVEVQHAARPGKDGQRDAGQRGGIRYDAADKAQQPPMGQHEERYQEQAQQDACQQEGQQAESLPAPPLCHHKGEQPEGHQAGGGLDAGTREQSRSADQCKPARCRPRQQTVSDGQDSKDKRQGTEHVGPPVAVHPHDLTGAPQQQREQHRRPGSDIPAPTFRLPAPRHKP